MTKHFALPLSFSSSASNEALKCCWSQSCNKKFQSMVFTDFWSFFTEQEGFRAQPKVPTQFLHSIVMILTLLFFCLFFFFLFYFFFPAVPYTRLSPMLMVNNTCMGQIFVSYIGSSSGLKSVKLQNPYLLTHKSTLRKTE